jgi:hypothetical protein
MMSHIQVINGKFKGLIICCGGFEVSLTLLDLIRWKERWLVLPMPWTRWFDKEHRSRDARVKYDRRHQNCHQNTLPSGHRRRLDSIGHRGQMSGIYHMAMNCNGSDDDGGPRGEVALRDSHPSSCRRLRSKLRENKKKRWEDQVECSAQSPLML